MIKFDHISKTYNVKKQAVHALQDVSLTVNDGDIFGIIGFSGAGKSTLIRMVNALEVPTKGHVEIDGQNINALSFSELRKVRKKIGMVFQQFNLLNSKTVFDNVAIPMILNKEPKEKIEARVKELLDFVELADKANVYPTQLSGGQKQRVGIARALATNPSILLCDEATSALDPDTTDAILNLLQRINKELNITILFVTHEIHVIQRICNRVAVMEQGHLVETGSVLDVFSNPKEAMTKSFVQTVIPDKIPENIIEDLHKDTRNYKLVKIRFLGSDAKKSSLCYINKHFDVETNVLFASVTQLQQTVLGIFIIQIVGDQADIDKVISFIETQNVQWQEVSIC